jgi:hypothetical protein
MSKPNVPRAESVSLDTASERMFWTCMTPGCEVVGAFTNEPTFCSICLCDLVGVYDTTGTLKEVCE